MLGEDDNFSEIVAVLTWLAWLAPSMVW